MKYLFLFLLLVTAKTFAQEPDSTSAIFKMRETERNFAKASVMIGRNAAFAEYFAEESLIFTSKWISNGKQFSKQRKLSPIVLKWEPEFMDISSGLDMGVSTGPWELQEYRPDTKPLAYGYFLTVWEKKPDGAWKVILDGGSESDPPLKCDHSFSFPAGADRIKKNPSMVNREISSAELMKTEKKLDESWAAVPEHSSHNSYMAEGARILINGHLPAILPDSINSVIKKVPSGLKWNPEGSKTASAGDFGFTYGTLRAAGNASATKGHYVRIWKKENDGSWKIEVEMINPD